MENTTLSLGTASESSEAKNASSGFFGLVLFPQESSHFPSLKRDLDSKQKKTAGPSKYFAEIIQMVRLLLCLYYLINCTHSF
ncbi:hypothetical protein D1864_08350 [Oceanobacillus picturae]|nr:hypothetical protein D1864_08350 [Oceanobacillus picturae]